MEIIAITEDKLDYISEQTGKSTYELRRMMMSARDSNSVAHVRIGEKF